MIGREDTVGRARPRHSRRRWFRLARITLPAAVVALASVANLPGLPFLGVDFGANSAWAKNDRGNHGNRGNRGHGREQRNARAVDAGPRVWNRPGRPDHADNGLHRGHDRAARDGTARAAAPPEGIVPPQPPWSDDVFRNHGDRVSTFVALAKAQGQSASVGAMQAKFGTPFENDLVAVDPDTGDYVVIADADEIAAVKPGDGPKSGWETETALDVNGDGTVDRTDFGEVLADGRPADGDSNDGADQDGPEDDDNGTDDDTDIQAAILRLGREDGDPAL